MDIGDAASWAAVVIAGIALWFAVRADRTIAEEKRRNAVTWRCERDPQHPLRVLVRNIGTERAFDVRLPSRSFGMLRTTEVTDGYSTESNQTVSFKLLAEEERRYIPDPLTVEWKQRRDGPTSSASVETAAVRAPVVTTERRSESEVEQPDGSPER